MFNHFGEERAPPRNAACALPRNVPLHPSTPPWALLGCGSSIAQVPHCDEHTQLCIIIIPEGAPHADQQEAQLTFLADPQCWHASKTISPSPNPWKAPHGRAEGSSGCCWEKPLGIVFTPRVAPLTLLPAQHHNQIPFGIANWDIDKCALKSHCRD